MSYSVGDKVVIRKENFEHDEFLLRRLEKHDFILTITKVYHNLFDEPEIHYEFEELDGYVLKERHLKDLWINTTIQTRFEILDL